MLGGDDATGSDTLEADGEDTGPPILQRLTTAVFLALRVVGILYICRLFRDFVANTRFVRFLPRTCLPSRRATGEETDPLLLQDVNTPTSSTGATQPNSHRGQRR